MKKYIIYTLTACALFFASCEKVVNIDLSEGNKRLVVEGTLKHYKDEPSNGFQSIKLSTTYAYFDTDPDNAVRNAIVSIVDNTDDTITLLEEDAENPGTYTSSDLVAQLNHSYTLKVSCELNGTTEEFEATEILKPVTDIDSIYQEFVEESLFDEEGYYARIDISDPASEKNFYKWDVFITRVDDPLGVPKSALEEVNGGTKREIIRDDEFLGENSTGISVYDNVAFPGDIIRIDQFSISEEAYYYFFNFYGLIAESGGDIPPAPVIGNIKNTNDPEDYGLGYFGVSSVTSKTITIVEDENP